MFRAIDFNDANFRLHSKSERRCWTHTFRTQEDVLGDKGHDFCPYVIRDGDGLSAVAGAPNNHTDVPGVFDAFPRFIVTLNFHKNNGAWQVTPRTY